MARLYLILEGLEDEETEDRRRRRRHMRLSLNLSLRSDADFVAEYRLSKPMFEDLCQELAPLLGRRRSQAISLECQVLTTLQFLATGSYQRGVGLNADAPMCQQSVSNCIRRVVDAMNNLILIKKYIKFPQNRREREELKSRFYEVFGFPGVIGSIDGTHVSIVRPYDNEYRYFNRHFYHSLNVLAICDADLNILHVDASYGGNDHDSYVWSRCEIKDHLASLAESGEKAILLGDSGYPLRKYLMIPFLNTENAVEEHYNIMQKRARNSIERCFGVLKGRFRCLLSARQLHYSPVAAGKIVNACAMLHNRCNRAGLEAPNLNIEERENEARMQLQNNAPNDTLNEGQAERLRLCNQLWQLRQH